MQTIFVAASVALCLTLAGKALRSDLEAAARGVILDDLGEYAYVYEKVGVDGIHQIFASGHHNEFEALRILRADGTVMKEMERSKRFAWPETARLRRMSEVKGMNTVEHPEGMPTMLIGRRVLHDGSVLWYGRTDTVDKESVDHIRLYLWLAGAGAAMIAMVPLFWFGGQVMQPVRRMIQSAKALAGGAGEERLVATSAVHELQDFALAFNTVLDRNQALTTELQNANDQLAHELRTPLARIRGNLEMMLDEKGADTHDAAERAMDEIDRAASLIDTILTVRAGDNGALKLRCETASVRELVEELIELYAVAAEDKHLRLTVEAGEDVTLSMDTQLMTQALANLLDNALRYTPADGQVMVTIKSESEACTISVMDTGPGLAANETELIWERFRRGSVASARNPGMGLGLSLVRAVVVAHGGSVGCGNRESGGAVFWMKLPVSG